MILCCTVVSFVILLFVFFLMIRRPPRSTLDRSSAASDVYKRQLLVDGLAAEREQGITIDVAYRFFSTERRKFIVADTPGHEPVSYTHLRAHETVLDLVCRLLLEKKKHHIDNRHECSVR